MTPLLAGLAAIARATAPIAEPRRGGVASIADAARRRSASTADAGRDRAEFADVLLAAQSGFPWARERLYSAYVADLAAYARGHDVVDPGALANDTLLAALRRIGRFRGGETQFEIWIYTIARNGLAVGTQRHRRRRRPAELRVERAADLGVRDAAILLHALPDELRDVVLLRGVGDLETDQIAEILGVTMTKAHMLRRRAAVAMLQLVDYRAETGRASGLASVQQRVSAAGLMGEVPRPTAELRALFGPEVPAATEDAVAGDDGGGFARRVASLGAATLATALVSLTLGGPLGVLPVSKASAAVEIHTDRTDLPTPH
jgi:DNA-directed RNA polymerase specialized sigma24 family protein